MILTLSTRPVPQPRERSVVPACLQPGAPLSYEIRDEDNWRVTPTLAGYKLRRGKTYRLSVRTQEKVARNWKLRLLAPRSMLEPAGPDEMDSDARVVTFHTIAPAFGEPWRWFRSSVTSLPVHLDYENGQEPYRFSIPVVLLASRFRWIGYLLLTILGSLVSEAVIRDRLAVPTVANLAVFSGVWAVVIVGCTLWDQWKFYRQAQCLIAKGSGSAVSNDKPLSSTEP